MGHYARDVDIVSIELDGFDGRQVVGDDHEWGVILRDRETGRTVGFEIWNASELLPGELLDALPEPVDAEITVDGGGGTQPHAA
jgi:uncharacterized protein YuzE